MTTPTIPHGGYTVLTDEEIANAIRGTDPAGWKYVTDAGLFRSYEKEARAIERAVLDKLYERSGAYHPTEVAVREACDLLDRIKDAYDSHWGGWSGTPGACDKAINLLRYSSTAAPAVQAAPAVPINEDERAELERLRAIIHTPQRDDFLRAVSTEAEFQRQRWGSDHDAGKTPADWFWLLGYLGGKALYSHIAGDTEKAEHHIITAAAACANWHLAMFGKTDMRPGIDPGAQGERHE